MDRRIEIGATDLLSVQETAQVLQKPRVTIYRWIQSGKILGLRLGGTLFVPRSEVERYQKEARK